MKKKERENEGCFVATSSRGGYMIFFFFFFASGFRYNGILLPLFVVRVKKTFTFQKKTILIF